MSPAESYHAYFLLGFRFPESLFGHDLDGVYLFRLHAFDFVAPCEPSLSEEAAFGVATDHTVSHFAISLFDYLLILRLDGIIS